MNETLEFCFKCDEPTGCAGKADDSWYNEDNEGPFCWRCWCEDQFPKVTEEVEALQQQISTLQAELDDYHNAEKFIADPPHDEIHCGCVGILRKQLTDLQEKIKEVCVGNMEAPPYDDTDPMTGKKRIIELAPEFAYAVGYHTGVLVCGEILSKPPKG